MLHLPFRLTDAILDLLDTRTLLLTITALLVARALVLVHVWRTMRDYAPLGYWTAGSTLVALGALLAGLREIAPPGISIILAQACIVPGWLLIDGGIVLAAGRRVPWRFAIALLAILFPALVWYAQVDPDYVARTVVTTLPAIVFDLYALAACLGVRSGRQVTTLRILAAALALLVISNAWKMLGTLTLQITSLLQANPPLTQFLVVSMIFFIVTTGIFVLLAAQQVQDALDRELAVRRQAEAELARHRDELEVMVRERTAELHERSEQLAQTAFAMDRVGIGIAWTDARTGRFIYVNDDACRQLGYAREELLALGISDINPSVAPGAPDAATRALASDISIGTLTAVPGGVAFDGNGEAWFSDGTPQGTRFLGEIQPMGVSSPHRFVRLGSMLLFFAQESVHGMELWRADLEGGGRMFYTLTPCRVSDTRNPDDGPPIIPGVPRDFQVAGRCGIPVDVAAVVLNVTVVAPTSNSPAARCAISVAYSFAMLVSRVFGRFWSFSAPARHTRSRAASVSTVMSAIISCTS